MRSEEKIILGTVAFFGLFFVACLALMGSFLYFEAAQSEADDAIEAASDIKLSDKTQKLPECFSTFRNKKAVETTRRLGYAKIFQNNCTEDLGADHMMLTLLVDDAPREENATKSTPILTEDNASEVANTMFFRDVGLQLLYTKVLDNTELQTKSGTSSVYRMVVYFNHGLMEPVSLTRLYYPEGRTVTLMSGMPQFEGKREEKMALEPAWELMEKNLARLIDETELKTDRTDPPQQ